VSRVRRGGEGQGYVKSLLYLPLLRSLMMNIQGWVFVVVIMFVKMMSKGKKNKSGAGGIEICASVRGLRNSLNNFFSPCML
jgi:hypothetical protein